MAKGIHTEETFEALITAAVTGQLDTKEAA